jgi:hypothetical protein
MPPSSKRRASNHAVKPAATRDPGTKGFLARGTGSDQSAVRLSQLGSAFGPEFVTSGHSLVLRGPSGTGKTHH